MKARPMPTRPIINTAKTGDHAWTRVKTPIPRKDKLATRHGLYLESHRLVGMARIRLPMSTEDPSHPCSEGERSRSSEMSGSSSPRMKVIARAIATDEVIEPMTTTL